MSQVRFGKPLTQKRGRRFIFLIKTASCICGKWAMGDLNSWKKKSVHSRDTKEKWKKRKRMNGRKMAETRRIRRRCVSATIRAGGQQALRPYTKAAWSAILFRKNFLWNNGRLRGIGLWKKCMWKTQRQEINSV